MAELRAGKEVHIDTRGNASAVYAFSHRMTKGMHRFVRIETESHTLTISARHLLYANANAAPARAASVKPGDVLVTVSGPQRVVATSSVTAEGFYAPHTLHGDAVVDSILTSTYTALMPRDAAHAALAAVRAIARLGKQPTF